MVRDTRILVTLIPPELGGPARALPVGPELSLRLACAGDVTELRGSLVRADGAGELFVGEGQVALDFELDGQSAWLGAPRATFALMRRGRRVGFGIMPETPEPWGGAQ